MLGIILKSLDLVVETTEGSFSSSIPFKKGLNIIRAENTSGKSTCVNAIVYALGLEAVLGPRGKRPFAKSLYDIIEDRKNNPKNYYVVASKVFLDIENSSGRCVTLARDIKGSDDNKISVCEAGKTEDYFLGSSGTAGSAKSKKGFHYWLENFMGWKLPSVAKFDGGESKLYLECIFPLFFIEQKRGWSEIQANTPTTWGLKNVKKNAIQFCLGLEGFELEKTINELNIKISKAISEWDNLRTKVKDIAHFSSLRSSQISDINEKDGYFSVQFLFPENDSFTNVHSNELSIRRYIEELSDTPADQLLNDHTLQQHSASIRTTRREIEETNNSIELVIISLRETEQKIATLRRDHDQYQQLRRLQNVGGDISADLDTKVCPICDNKLLDTLGSNTAKRKPMTLDENIQFLKNQLDFYKSIKSRNQDKLEFLNSTLKLLNDKLDYETKILQELKADLRQLNGEEINKLRKKIEAEAKLETVLKIKESQEELNKHAKRIRGDWSSGVAALKSLRESSRIGSFSRAIEELQALLRSNLKAFGFNPSAINFIALSRQTLRPEQEGYDIVAESSASDYIRIIWSYSLALLELAGNNDSSKHGGFVVFDEPRQQEANKLSFINLIDKASKSSVYNGQVIFATSIDRKEIEVACTNINVNLISFDDDDYILTLDEE